MVAPTANKPPSCPPPGSRLNGEQYGAVSIPDVTGLSDYEAALAYTSCGLYLLPVDPQDPKNPGSVVGKGWPQKSTRDPDIIEAYWDIEKRRSIGVHTGRSNLVVFDLDVDAIPAEVAWLKTAAIQHSRPGGDRGHYVFASDQTFVSGKFCLADGTQIGEIRSGNSVFIVAPSVHANAATGAGYWWETSGPVPELPEVARNCLRLLSSKGVGGDGSVVADSAAVAQFKADTAGAGSRPAALDNLTRSLSKKRSGTRDCLRNYLRVTACEARANFYPYQRAIDELEAAARASYELRASLGEAGADFDGHIGSGGLARLVANGVGYTLSRSATEIAAEVNRDYGTNSKDNAGLVDGFSLRTESGESADGTSGADVDEPPSWAPVDMAAELAGGVELTPSILARTDGESLFYRGKTHSVHGESESGKTWLVLCAAAELLLAGEPVLYLDFEDDAKGIGNRLLLLGVPTEAITNRDLFVYVRPEASLSAERERAAFKALLKQRYSLAVIDGVTESMGLFGLLGKDNDQIATWQRELPNAIVRATGAAVVVIDHVTKDVDGRGRFSVGGQQKMNGLKGAAFTIEPESPFGRGLAGVAALRVGKDRPGYLRAIGGDWRKSDRTQAIGTFWLDSTGSGLIRWKVDPPDDGQSKAGTPGEDSRRKWCMEQVSRYWETQNPDGEENPKLPALAACSSNKTETAMIDQHKGAGIARDSWRAAIGALVVEGYAKQVDGPRKSKLHRVIRPYRELADETPNSPQMVFQTVSQAKYVGEHEGDLDEGNDLQTGVTA